MAQNIFTRFNYYRRYKWRAQDFTDLQNNLVIAAPASHSEGLLGAAVLSGGDISIAGFNVSVNPFIAASPSGDVLALDSVSTISVPPISSLPVRSLVVARTVLTDSTFMPRPTNPFDSVPLKTLQSTQVVLISGTPSASADYPAKQSGDVVLFGIRQDNPSALALVASNIDWDVRDEVGKNSLISKGIGHFDDRLRPYKSTTKIMGLKPSQVISKGSQLFSYVAKGRVSKYPKDIGDNFNANDSFINFQSGAITGGDASSPALTPQIPAAGKYKTVTVAMQTNDTLAFAFGADGTLVQCLDGVRNRTSIGAGSVNLLKLPMICYVIIGSYDGVNITSLDILDARSIFSSSGTETVGAHETPTGVIDGSNKVFILNQIPLSDQSLLVYIDGIKLPASGYSLVGQTVTLVDAPALGQSIEVFYLQDGVGAFNAPVGSGNNALIPIQEVPFGTVDGSNRIFTLSQAPYSDDSLQVYINGLEVPKANRMVAGSVVTLDVSFAPPEGADIQSFYFVTGSIGPAPTGAGASVNSNVEYPILSSGDIAAKNVSLTNTPLAASAVVVDFIGGGPLVYNVDFSISGNQVQWSGLTLDGFVSAGDQLRVQYFS